jgi:hypothetical protein
MSSRLILKQPTGWFAAGREVARALALLSDAAFKLYIHLCLEADRYTGRAVIEPTALARIFQRDAASIEASLGELHFNKVCERRGSGVEICDPFWPYQKHTGATVPDPESEFVRRVRTDFLKPACVSSAFTAADEKLALNHCRHGTTLDQVRHAIWLGCARKYVTMLNGQTPLPITSLAYFTPLIEEVTQPQIPTGYWGHVRRKMEEMEKRWLETRATAPGTSGVRAETSTQEMI